jgi:hypothetical protein
MYPDARRRLYVLHDRWEVDLYREFHVHMDHTSKADAGKPDTQTLVELRGLVSLFHQFVSPLDASGLDVETFWFSGVNETPAKRLNASIGRSVSKLRELNDALRDDIDLVGLMLTNRQADQADKLQLSLQAVAAPVAAATIVVGWYGANTAAPDSWIGLGIMIAVTIVIGVMGYLGFRALLARLSRGDQPSPNRAAGGNPPTAPA